MTERSSLEYVRPAPIIIPTRDESTKRERLGSVESCFDYSSDEESHLEISPLCLTSSTASSSPLCQRQHNAITINDTFGEENGMTLASELPKTKDEDKDITKEASQIDMVIQQNLGSLMKLDYEEKEWNDCNHLLHPSKNTNGSEEDSSSDKISKNQSIKGSNEEESLTRRDVDVPARIILKSNILSPNTISNNYYEQLELGFLTPMSEHASRAQWDNSFYTPKVEKFAVSIREEQNVSSPDILNKMGLSPLSIASRRCYAEGMIILIENGSDIHTKDHSGRTPLHLVCENSTASEHQDCVELLLEKGADGNDQDNYGKSPLHIAAERGCFPCIRSLLRSGCCSCTQDQNGNTPLHIAVESQDIPCVKALLAAACNKNYCTRMNQKLSLIGEQVSSTEACHDHAEALNHDDLQDGDLYDENNLLASDNDNYKENSSGNLLQNTNSGNRSMEIWSQFFSNAIEADQNCCEIYDNNELRYPLHAASKLGDIDDINDLLNNGVDIDEVDNEGNTALHLAASAGQDRAVLTLLGNGAQTGLVNDTDHTPLAISSSHGFKQCANLLLKHDCENYYSCNRIPYHNNKGCLTQLCDTAYVASDSLENNSVTAISLQEEEQSSSSLDFYENYINETFLSSLTKFKLLWQLLLHKFLTAPSTRANINENNSCTSMKHIPKDLSIALEKAKSSGDFVYRAMDVPEDIGKALHTRLHD